MYKCVYRESQNIFRGFAAAFGAFFVLFFCFIGNILDGEHPTQLWLDGFQQPMKMASASLEDGIPASNTTDSSYPRLGSVPQDHWKHLHWAVTKPATTDLHVHQ